jgi:glycosyltransferase involved in cell wall biosynthesis
MATMLDRPHEYSYEAREDLLADRELLELSDIFDEPAYRAMARIPRQVDAAEHYLVEGWRRGLEPGPHFEGGFLYPYYCTIGFTGPPALTYVMLSANGPAAYRTRADAEAAAAAVRNSDYFEASAYREQFPGMGRLDPATHYVLVGEQLGYAPSEIFDPQYYKERNPDVAMNTPSALVHYLAHGCHEGRSPISSASRLTLDFSRLDPARQSVLVISHEASRTGAPILAYNVALKLREKYNVVALLLHGGHLIEEFQACCAAVVGPLTYAEWHPIEARRILRRLLGACKITYAIANSIESRHFVPWLPRAFVPVVSLVHEFASYTRPRDSMTESLDWATELVFSAELTAGSARSEHPSLSGRKIHVLPQGQCQLPPVEITPKAVAESATLRRMLRPESAEDALIVLGAGFVHIRKGVDLFIACAATVKALNPRRKVRFVWIGQGYDPENDVSYSCYLSEQIARSDLDDRFEIIGAVEDLDLVYSETDIFFLSSRLDPLPNVTIDAACRGIPVICFDGATGMAEILRADAATGPCVVPYVDVNAAARLIADLADDDAKRAEISDALRRIATATFNMDRYVGELDRLGTAAIAAMQQRALDCETLAADPSFDPMIFLRAGSLAASREEAIIDYLGYWSAVGLSIHSSKNAAFRRPCAGFHPQIYAYENAGRFDPLVNPLADYIRSGKPEGPWAHGVIVPSTEPAMLVEGLRIGLHGHFHYPELAADLFDKLMGNRSRCDLLLSTSSEAKAAVLRNVTSSYDRGEVVIRIVPNRGRDIGPFLSTFGDDIERYDIVGHIHGKRSIDVDEAMGDTWREFLWQNLVGDAHPMLDIITAAFAKDARLGLVFPEDPHMVGWDSNLDIATAFAQKMGIAEPLPPFFDFPIGTMFWARTAALLPMLKLRLGWQDYPDEPLPYDGTVLHALERLLPFSARHAGYRYATTHVPGITR